MKRAITFFALLSLLVGCASQSSIQITTQQAADRDAVTMTNGIVEITVVPELGRITHFARVGGPNLLYKGDLSIPLDKPGWKNYGGDKVWPWPQEDWRKWQNGEEWPPPPGFDPGQYELVIDGKRLIMRSQPDPIYHVRVVRIIEMPADEPKVRFINSFVPTDDAPADRLIAGVWTVTQIVGPETTVITDANNTRNMAEGMEGFVTRDNDRFVVTPQAKSDKAGFDGTTIYSILKGEKFIQRILKTNPEPYLDPTDAIQVYADKVQQDGKAGYLEMELSAPPARRSLLEVEWELATP